MKEGQENCFYLKKLMQSPAVFVIAEEPAVLDTLSDLFESAKLSCEIFTSTEAFLAKLDPEYPGCLLLDTSLPGISGSEFHSLLVQRKSILPVIILTRSNDARSAMEMLKGGALDFFEKPFDGGALLKAVRHAIEMDRANRHALRLRAEVLLRHAELTRREREIMNSMFDGKSSREIAAQLNMSARTVEFHRSRVKKKMGIATPVELVRMVATISGCHCIRKYSRGAVDVQP